MKTAHCPSCGADVEFRVPASVMAVCGYCRSTLVRTDAGLENLGRMAELMDDPTLIQLGATGHWRKQGFTVVGRIQLRYRQGLWNEWHLLFDNGRAGWLGEASGQCTVSFLTPPQEPLPPHGTLKPGAQLTLSGHRFTVTDLEEGHCVAGEGELPFRVGAGFPAASVDLRSGAAFATIDYSEAPPLLFLGESVAFADLRLAGLRQSAAPGQAQAQALRCSSCGAPIAVTTPGVKSVACGSCHAILDAADPQLKILSRFAARTTVKPAIALGREGVFEAEKFRVIGFLVRGLAGPTRYAWREYLLHNPRLGFRWLTESDGHWNWVQPLASNPTAARDKAGREALLFDGMLYRHFSSATAEVSYVAGEFYWQVAAGEAALVSDYIAPPQVISQEKSENEILWSLGRYLAPAAVQEAFGLDAALPAPVGVAANQPWALQDAYRASGRVGLACAAAVVLVQAFFVVIAHDQEVYSTALEIPPGKRTEAVSTEAFRLGGRPSNVQIVNRAQLDNDWIYLDMTLVNRDTGQTYEVSREIDYYHGCDEDGCWTEGDPGDAALISAVPAGNYYILVETETRPDAPAPLVDRLIVKRDVPGWLNFFLTLLGLAVFPLLYLWRRSAFERTRWAESDHPSDSVSDNDDD